jgi:hypothetical protein
MDFGFKVRGVACGKELKIIPGATHLFQEPGTLEAVAHLAADWFRRYLHKCHTPDEKTATVSG